jgi:myxalamid-type polyketide synthase MxaC
MGMDSLMAIELKGRLERSVGLSLPSAIAFNYPTVDALAKFLEARVAEEASNAETDVQELLSRLPEMSGAEVDSLLSKMMAEESAR